MNNIEIRKLTTHKDDRGWLFEAYKDISLKHNMPKIAQININYAKANTIKGLHFQLPPHDQAKIVTVIEGKIIDYVVDLRQKSKERFQLQHFQLSDSGDNQIIIPSGFAHGFFAIRDSLVHYSFDKLYEKKSERTINIFDESFNLTHLKSDVTISEKDIAGLSLKDTIDLLESNQVSLI